MAVRESFPLGLIVILQSRANSVKGQRHSGQIAIPAPVHQYPVVASLDVLVPAAA